MKLTIEIAMDNAAFEDYPDEAGRILNQVRVWTEDRQGGGKVSRSLTDQNGNYVGYARISD